MLNFYQEEITRAFRNLLTTSQAGVDPHEAAGELYRTMETAFWSVLNNLRPELAERFNTSPIDQQNLLEQWVKMRMPTAVCRDFYTAALEYRLAVLHGEFGDAGSHFIAAWEAGVSEVSPYVSRDAVQAGFGVTAGLRAVVEELRQPEQPEQSETVEQPEVQSDPVAAEGPEPAVPTIDDTDPPEEESAADTV